VRKPKLKKWSEAEIRELPDNELVGLSLNSAYPEEIQQLALMHARAREVKDPAKIQPIDHAVIAHPHTPIYRMHRYYARRPWSVFNELILHYSNPGDIILDPFCGGGVTVVEGVRLGRKVIGVDMNPLAAWITRMELADVDLEELDKGFQDVAAAVKSKIQALYQTKCPKCGRKAVADWVEHSTTCICPHCAQTIVLANAPKLQAKSLGAASQGYRCPNCEQPLRSVHDAKCGEVPVAVSYSCDHCNSAGRKAGGPQDVGPWRGPATYRRTKGQTVRFRIPDEPFPDGNLQRENAIFDKGIRTFADFFTERNLLANGMLKCAILAADVGPAVRDTLLLCFSATLAWTSRMINDTGHGWQRSAYWLPDVYFEQNVWRMFEQRYHKGQSTVRRGVLWASDHMPRRTEANSFRDLTSSATHWILRGSSHDIPLPDGSVDAIVTDPPYGGNVQYCELSDFWAVWLKETGVLDSSAFGEDGLIDTRCEAIQTRHQGFATAKPLKHYRDMMHRIFQECHRVLKPNGWMVMTFHNREFKVWNALHAAAHDAGFLMPEQDGLIYQPPIQNYTQTLQLRRRGSMLGDFIVSFKRAEALPQRQMIPEVEIGSRVRKEAREAIAYHGSASLSTIYMRLVPFLVNGDLLEKVKEKDIVQFLTDDFETRTDKEGNERWYFKEAAEPRPVTPLDFVPVPVEARIEYVIRSLLRRNRHATQDEILNMVYSQLINGNAAEYQEIQRVLQRICVLRPVAGKTRQAYMLREKAEEQQLLDLFAGQQPGLAEQQLGARAESEHDLIIEDLALLGIACDCQIHIGRSEQGKYVRFKQWSKPMTYPPEFGIHPDAFDKITQIDTLWLRGQAILSAFEVEKSTTIDSGINRFRELFAALPNLSVPAYLVVPDSREEETRGKLGSLANRRDSLTTKVRYLVFSDIMGKPNVNLESVARQVA